ncbi:unnamed protein product [Tilletia controversa]|nr:unnamed protein product [Tilletia controversa]CAD6976250.1 unnamed protein product [Tilletia controversa]
MCFCLHNGSRSDDFPPSSLRQPSFFTLPSLDDAAKDFESLATLRPKLDPSIEKHDEASLYGVQRLHSHFDLQADQRLVTYGRVSVPLDLDLDLLDATSAAKIKECAFRTKLE